MRFKQAGVFIAIFIFLFGISFAQDIDSVRAEIYSKIHCCACREAFAQCVCQEAKEMKAYIEAFLEAGVAKDEVYYKVAKKYSLNVIIDPQIKLEIEKRLINEAGVKRPQLVLEPRSFDFGELRKRQGIVKKIVTISNKGTDKLIIKNIRTSCGCVNVSLKTGEEKSPFFSTSGAAPGWQTVIDAGKSGVLEITVDLQHSSVKPGKLIREVQIFSNDPLYPEAILMLYGEVEE